MRRAKLRVGQQIKYAIGKQFFGAGVIRRLADKYALVFTGTKYDGSPVITPMPYRKIVAVLKDPFTTPR